MLHPKSAAMLAGTCGILGLWFIQLAVGVAVLAANLASQGNAWAFLLVPVAAASTVIGLTSVRRLAGALVSARR